MKQEKKPKKEERVRDLVQERKDSGEAAQANIFYISRLTNVLSMNPVKGDVLKPSSSKRRSHHTGPTGQVILVHPTVTRAEKVEVDLYGPCNKHKALLHGVSRRS